MGKLHVWDSKGLAFASSSTKGMTKIDELTAVLLWPVVLWLLPTKHFYSIRRMGCKVVSDRGFHHLAFEKLIQAAIVFPSSFGIERYPSHSVRRALDCSINVNTIIYTNVTGHDPSSARP